MLRVVSVSFYTGYCDSG